MSASRKKQQRNEDETPVVSSRVQEEMAKEAQRKRNTIIYTIIGIVVVILAAILLIWDSGAIQRNAAAATIDGEKVIPAQVSYHYHNNTVMYMAQTYYSYGLDYHFSMDESPKDQTITAEVITELGLDEKYLDKTYHEYFLDYALETLRKEFALVNAAKQAGYTLSAEGQQAVEDAFAEVDANRAYYMSNYGANLSRDGYLQQIYGNIMNEKLYRTCLENAQLAAEFSEYGFDTLTDYTEEELRAYYPNHTNELDSFRLYYRYFDAADAEDTEDAMAAAMEAANAALSEVVAGGLAAVKDNADYTEQFGPINESSFYYDWLTDPARQSGDASVFEATAGYYLAVFAERYLDETPTVDVRHILVSAMPEDDPDTEDVDESDAEPTYEDFAAAEQKAQEILDQWKTDGGTEEAFAALAEEHSADYGSNSNGGLYEDVFNGRFIPSFNNWLFGSEHQSGDTGLVKNTQSSTQGWHIIYFVEQNELPYWMLTARESKWVDDLENNVEIVRSDKLDSYFN